MKKMIFLLLCSSLVLSSCDTYTGSGAYAGGSIGSILGSAIGGLSGGPRGSIWELSSVWLEELL